MRTLSTMRPHSRRTGSRSIHRQVQELVMKMIIRTSPRRSVSRTSTIIRPLHRTPFTRLLRMSLAKLWVISGGKVPGILPFGPATIKIHCSAAFLTLYSSRSYPSLSSSALTLSDRFFPVSKMILLRCYSSLRYYASITRRTYSLLRRHVDSST